MTKTNFIILVGLPGSGKTTMAKYYQEHLPGSTVYVSGDDMRIMLGCGKYLWEPKCESILLDLLIHIVFTFSQSYDNVILDESFLSNTEKIRKKLIDHFLDPNWTRVRFHYCDTTKETCLDRRMKEPKGFASEKWVEAIERHFGDFQPPIFEEFAKINGVELIKEISR